MKNRKNYLKSRKTKIIWNKIGDFSDNPCPKCGELGVIQIYKHDACACINCNEWLENTCADVNCPFCSGRPDTPYEVYWKEKETPSNALVIKRWRQDNYFHKEKGRQRHRPQL